jgi:hypothetical protein
LLVASSTPRGESRQQGQRAAQADSFAEEQECHQAANRTVMALQIAPIAAGERCAAHANSKNGMAELIKPIKASLGQMAAIEGGTIAPQERQHHQRPQGQADVDQGERRPNGFAATRMNRNDPPHMAPSTSNSMGVRQSRSAIAGLRPASTTADFTDIAPARICTRTHFP